MRYEGSEQGFTIVELIVAATMMVVITGAAVSLLVSSMQHQVKVTDRADQVGDARNAIEKITVDLRQGSEVMTEPTPERLVLSTLCDASADGAAGPCTVTYSCTGTTCTRQVGAGTARTVVSGLSSTEVFCYVPSIEDPESECGERPVGAVLDPVSYVGATIELPSSEQGDVTVLEDGAALHNSPELLGG